MMEGIHISPTPQALAAAVAQELGTLVASRPPTPGQIPFSIALAGGTTPRLLYELLATSYRTAMDWERLHFFWGDERCVPPAHADSNFLLASDTLLRHVAVPPLHVHRIPGEMTPPHKAAVVYTSMLQEFFQADALSPPCFDLILLGMGKDGHTASLFPKHSALQEKTRWVTDVFETSVTPPWRISLTLPVLQRARHIWFLVAGADKRDIFQQIANNPHAAAERYPAAQVHISAPDVRWFVDAAVATP